MVPTTYSSQEGVHDNRVQFNLEKQLGSLGNLTSATVRRDDPKDRTERMRMVAGVNSSSQHAIVRRSNARVGYGFRGGLRLVPDVFNLLDREDEDIQYSYASRLPAGLSPTGVAEPVEGVEDIHFHPMEPRSLRAWLEYQF